MAAPEEAPRAADLAWSAWPARGRPLAAAVIVAAAIVLGILVARGTHDAVLGWATPLLLLVSLSSFLLPTEYRLTPDALEVRILGVVRVRPWAEMKRMTVDATGVFLSPFERRNWLDAYRGVRLLFGGNRDQVVAYVKARIGRGAA